MKRFILIVISLMAAAGALSAQERWASGFGLDPSDEEALKEINARMDSIRQHRPTVALVLSGGGAKGAAHVGAIRHLESLGIPVDMVLGTSMGGLVGGLYALGYDGEYLDSLVRSLDWDLCLSDRIDRKFIPDEVNRYNDTYVLSVPFFYRSSDYQAMLSSSKDGVLHLGAASGEGSSLIRQNILRSLPSGMVEGLNVNYEISSLTVGYSDSLDFFKFPIPFACVATDLVSGRAKVWHSGNINTALRSTMSIPGLFNPVRTGNMVLVDGGMRNNFPCDLARDMGADLIIGVELSQADYGYDEIRNIVDIIWQGVDLMSSDSFRRNLKINDLKIKPDLEGYNMMSFSPEAVDTIIVRGYRAALEKDPDLRIIKAWTGSDTLTCQAPRSTDINNTPVLISGIEVEGLEEEEAGYVFDYFRYLLGTEVDRKTIEGAVSGLFGTGYFDSVRYELCGDGEPYRLRVICRPGPIHQMGVGVRADTEELVSILLNIGFNVHNIAGHALDLTAKIGTNPYAEALYRYRPLSGPDFNVRSKLRYVDRNQFSIGDNRFKVNYLNFRNEVFLSGFGWKGLDMRLGVRSDYYHLSNVMTNRTIEEYEFVSMPDNYLSGFFQAGDNTFNDGYFPTRGHKLDISGSLIIGGLDQSIGLIGEGSLGYRQAIPLAPRLTLVPSFNARVVLGDEKPLPYINLVGGRLAGRYLDQQIPFMGVVNAVAMSPILAVAGLDLRYSPLPDHYFSAIVNFGHDASSFREFVSPTVDTVFSGAGVEYAYNTVAGPLRADLHWSSLTGKVGLYISFGYDF